MAVDYSQYAQIYGGGNVQQGAAQLGAGIGAGFSRIPNVMDKLAASQGEGLDNAFAPLLGLLGKGVEEWGDIDKIPSAGEAYMGWVNSMSPRQKRMARRRGVLNPVAYKQQYDAQMEMYLPAIKEKLESYRTMGNKSDKSMREFLSTKSGLNQFLLANTSPEELALNPYFKPKRTLAQWAEGQGGPVGVGGQLAKAGFIGGFGATGMTGLRGGLNQYERFKSPTGLSKKDMTALEKAAKSSKYGESLTKQSQARKVRKVGTAKSVLTKAQNKYSTKEKAWKKKGGKVYSRSIEGKKIQASINSAKANLGAANKTQVKGVKDVLSRAIKKHGKGKLIRMMAKKVGIKGAVSLLAKTGLAAVPGGQIIGGALLLNDIRMIYNTLSDLAE
jgi:hypothetical protein